MSGSLPGPIQNQKKNFAHTELQGHPILGGILLHYLFRKFRIPLETQTNIMQGSDLDPILCKSLYLTHFQESLLIHYILCRSMHHSIMLHWRDFAVVLFHVYE